MPIKHLNLWRKVYPDAMFVNVCGPTEITCNCNILLGRTGSTELDDDILG